MRISGKLKKRHLRTRVIKRIEDVPAGQWNKIFPNIPEGYFFLKTLDESNFDQFIFYYILVYEHQQLVGCAPCFSVDYPLDTSINGPLRRLTNAIKKTFPGIFNVKALVCGIPMGQGQLGISGYTSSLPETNNPYSLDVVEAIEMRMEMLARKVSATFIAFKDFDKSYDHFFDPLLKNGYLKVDSLPMTRMELEFADFEEYLKTLSSSTRYDYRRKLKKSAKAKIGSSVVSTLDENTLNEVYSLYLQVVGTHEMGFEIVPKEFFRLISKNMPQQTKFFLQYVNDKLASFAFCLVSGDLMLDYYLGFDYAPAYQYNLYFIKFKETISWCLANGIKTYEMGDTGYEAKRRLDFKFVPVYLYVKIRHKLLRPCLKVLCSLLKFENFDPELKRWKRSLK